MGWEVGFGSEGFRADPGVLWRLGGSLFGGLQV